MDLKSIRVIFESIYFEKASVDEMMDSKVSRRKFIVENITKYPSTQQLCDALCVSYNTVKVDILYLVKNRLIKSAGKLSDLGVKGASGNGVIYAKF